MKKSLSIALVLLMLCGCGATKSERVCTLNNNEAHNTIRIYYDAKGQISEYKLVSKQTIDESTVKAIGSSKIESYIEKTYASLETAGVKVDTDFNHDNNEVTMTMLVNVDDLSKKDYKKYYLPDNKKLNTMINTIEKVGFKCK